MLTKGAIFFHPDFIYSNGNKADKLLILLNDPGEYCFFIPATSKHRGRPKIKGCLPPQHQCFFVFANQTFFEEDTWLPLFEPYLCTPDATFLSNNRPIGQLKEKTVDGIIACALASAKDDYNAIELNTLCPPVEVKAKALQDLFNSRRN